MQQIYATDFIAPELHLSLLGFLDDSSMGYTSLSIPIDKKTLQIRISKSLNEKVVDINEAGSFKNLYEKIAFERFLKWIDTGKVRPLTEEESVSLDYKKIGVRKSIAKLFSPSVLDNISLTIHDHEFDDATGEKEKLEKAICKLLVSNSEIKDNKFEFLFKVDELSLIDNENKKSWYEYIYDYTVPCKTIRIIDPYFIKNNREISIRTILGKLIGGSPFKAVDIDIITNLSKSFDKDREEEYKAKAIDWVEENSDQPVNITVYDVVRNHKNYHDRYLWTDYWNLKVPAGIDGNIANKTIPTLVGRYSSKDGSWNYVNENWENWTQNDCEIIEQLKTD